MKSHLSLIKESDAKQLEENILRGHIISLITNLVMFVIMFLFFTQIGI